MVAKKIIASHASLVAPRVRVKAALVAPTRNLLIVYIGLISFALRLGISELKKLFETIKSENFASPSAVDQNQKHSRAKPQPRPKSKPRKSKSTYFIGKRVRQVI